MKGRGTFPSLALLLYLLQWLVDLGEARKGSCGLNECPSEAEPSLTTETTKAIVVVMSVTILLIVCLIAVLIILCLRKSASVIDEIHTDDHEEALEAQPYASTLRQIQENDVEIPSYIRERQMSLASSYSGPPPYFSIFKLVNPETGEIRGTCIGGTNAVLNFVTSVESIEECPPDYEGVVDHLPPTYEQVLSSHQEKEVTWDRDRSEESQTWLTNRGHSMLKEQEMPLWEQWPLRISLWELLSNPTDP